VTARRWGVRESDATEPMRPLFSLFRPLVQQPPPGGGLSRWRGDAFRLVRLAGSAHSLRLVQHPWVLRNLPFLRSASERDVFEAMAVLPGLGRRAAGRRPSTGHVL